MGKRRGYPGADDGLYLPGAAELQPDNSVPSVGVFEPGAQRKGGHIVEKQSFVSDASPGKTGISCPEGDTEKSGDAGRFSADSAATERGSGKLYV